MFSRPGLFLVMTLLCFCHPMAAQDDEGYMFEMGLGGGGSFYMGDANSRLYRNTDGMFTLIARYNVNRRFSLKCGLAAAGISGSSENSNGTLPGDAVDFSRTLYEFEIQAEWGFCGHMLRDPIHVQLFPICHLFLILISLQSQGRLNTSNVIYNIVKL
jgi:hypothetical protein